MSIRKAFGLQKQRRFSEMLRTHHDVERGQDERGGTPESLLVVIVVACNCI